MEAGNKVANLNLMTRALNNLLNTKVKELLEDVKFKWQNFRDDELWSYPVELTYTINDKNIKDLYNKYASMTNKDVLERDPSSAG